MSRRSCHLDADSDRRAGNDRGIVVLGVGDIEAALDGLHGDVADGQGALDLFEINPLWPLDTDRHLHIQLGLVDLQRTNERQRAVMQRVLHGAERGLGVVGAVQVVAGAQLENGARFWHRCFLQTMSRLTTTQALAINVLSVPLSLWILRPPSTTETEPFP